MVARAPIASVPVLQARCQSLAILRRNVWWRSGQIRVRGRRPVDRSTGLAFVGYFSVLHAVLDRIDQVLAQDLGRSHLHALGVRRWKVLGQYRQRLRRGITRQQHVLQVRGVTLGNRAFHGRTVGTEGHHRLRGGGVGSVEEHEGAVFWVRQVLLGLFAHLWVG